MAFNEALEKVKKELAAAKADDTAYVVLSIEVVEALLFGAGLNRG